MNQADGEIVGGRVDESDGRDAETRRAVFWAEIGHDLRQPLYAAKLLTVALRGEPNAAKRAVIYDDLMAALAAMEGLLDQTIDYGKLQAGSVQADIRNFAVADVIGDVAREAAVLAAVDGLELRMVGCSCSVRSDPILLRKILANLAGNAVRYTEAGRVLIGCRRRGRELGIEIWDTGIGVDERQQEEIFGAFRRGTGQGGRKNEGLGLGLSIVRRTAEVLGHTVYVKSRAGAGSMFAIVVPLAEY